MTIFLLILSHLFVLVHAISRGVLEVGNKQGVFHILSDAFFVPSVFLLGIGILSLIAKDGQFTGLTYSFYVFKQRIPFLSKDKETLTYHDYRQKSKKNDLSFWPLIGIGIYFLVMAFIFSRLFNANM